MRNYRRYKNAKIETLCQMEVVKPPTPCVPPPGMLEYLRGMQNNQSPSFIGQQAAGYTGTCNGLVAGLLGSAAHYQ